MEYAIGFDNLPKALKELATTQIPFVVSKVMNNGLFHTHKGLVQHMDSGAIKGGAIPFTKKGMRFKKATKATLHANLRFETEGNYSRAYMIPILRGGTRVAKNKKLPDVDKEAYSSVLTKKGNFKRNWLQNAMAEAESRKSGGKGSKGFFTVKVNANTSILKQRKKTGDVVDLVWFSEKQREQRQTFDGFDFAEDTFLRYWRDNFPQELEIITYNELFYRLGSRLRLRRL